MKIKQPLLLRLKSDIYDAKQYLDDDERLDDIIQKSGYKIYEGNDFMNEHEKIIDSNNDEVKKQEDPIEAYGYGVVAYFSLLEYLAKLFAFFSIFAFIMLYIYKTNNYES